MFLRIVRVRSTEQSGIIGVKIPFDPNIIIILLQVPNSKCGEKECSEKVLIMNLAETHRNC